MDLLNRSQASDRLAGSPVEDLLTRYHASARLEGSPVEDLLTRSHKSDRLEGKPRVGYQHYSKIFVHTLVM